MDSRRTVRTGHGRNQKVGVRMFDISRRITALELALDYTPGQDDNHSHSVLLEMLDELRTKEKDLSGGNREEVQ